MLKDKPNFQSPHDDVQNVINRLRNMNAVLESEAIDDAIILLLDMSMTIDDNRKELTELRMLNLKRRMNDNG